MTSAARVLAALADAESLTTAKVVAATGLGRHAVWAAIRKLVRHGEVSRSPGKRLRGVRWRLVRVPCFVCPTCGGRQGRLF